MGKRAIALLLLAFAAAGLLVYSQFRRSPFKVSGFVEAYEIRIGSRVGGRVHKVLVEEGARVKPGDTLLELDPFDLLQRHAQAQADLANRTADYEKVVRGFRPEEIAQAKAEYDQLAARLSELENGPRKQEISAAESQVRLADAELMLAQQNMGRIETLIRQNAATREELDQATTNLRVARARLEVRQEELALLREGTRPEQIQAAKAQLDAAEQVWLLRKNGYRTEEVAQAKAAVEAAQAAINVLDQQIAELKIAAPLEGIIEALDLRPGDIVSPNAPALSLMDISRLWVRAYVPENALDLSIDQPLWVSVDSFPKERFRGHVSFIAREAEFTPSNIQTPEERSKQVFRIRVTLDEGLDRLRPGMSADVWLDEEPKRSRGVAE